MHQSAGARICPICRVTIEIKDSSPSTTLEIMPAMTARGMGLNLVPSLETDHKRTCSRQELTNQRDGTSV